jgi:hypothetical protein
MELAVDGRMTGRPPGRGLLWGGLGISRLHRSGVSPQRVLVVGSRSLLRRAAMRAALPQLTEDLADRLWLSTRRGLDVDVVWELRRLLRAVLRGLAALRISRYDVVVLLTAPEAAARGRERTRRLALAILRQMSPRARFLSVVLEADGPTVLDPSRWDPTAGATAEPDIPTLSAVLGSGATADAIARRLESPAARGADAPGQPDPAEAETLRERAVEALTLEGRPDDVRLQRLVEMACDAFGTRFAEVNIVGREVQWSLAAAGLARGSRPAHQSLCELAVQRAAPTVVRDTLREMPVDRIPRLTDGRLVRFYAGYPIQSVDGHRIGVLCVYDTRPHRVGDSEVSTLRDLTLLAEARLIGV